MKKRWISLVLALTLLGALSVPAAAAETADSRLAAVTAQVKKTLGLDTERYTAFYGDLAEDILAPTWYLEWSGEGGSLAVSASETGKVLNYRLYEQGESVSSGTFAPTFPAGDPAAAEAAARKFVDRVLTRGETATIKANPIRLGATAYRFSGEILLNGLPAGLSYSISVRCEDNVITSFYRDDLNGTVMSGVPSAVPGISQAKAGETLRETLALRLEYVLPEGEQKAVLRYLPEYGDEYYVDAATGTLINLTQLRKDVAAGGSNNTVSKEETAAEAPSAAADGGLSKVEQEGVERLKKALSREELDGKARAVKELGLSAYTLSTVDYTVAREEEAAEHAVTATLRYGRQVNGSAWRRIVTLDAETGALIGVYSSGRLIDGEPQRTVDMKAAQKTAEAFLSRQNGSEFAKTALYDSSDAAENARRVSHSFIFAQKANGYFFPQNSFTVDVDATDGSISGYSRNFDNSVTFADPAGILTMEQALDAWLNTYTVQLGYVRVPTAVDYANPKYQPLMDYGISYLYQLVLGYTLEREDYLLGIDAKTGEAVQPDWVSADGTLSYGDVSGHWAKSQIERLAQYGVGWQGGLCRPDDALTQLDLVALLASTEGYHYDGGYAEAADDLYEFAFNLGILRREERKDSAILTRMETVRLILDAVGYGGVAQLQGIFRTRFADDAAIPAASYGYAALAQGLGMVQGDGANRFLPNRTATRAQAAVMLCNLMSHR